MPLGPQGGLISFPFVSSATNNCTLVYAGPCHLDLVTGFNLNAAARYIKFYDTGVQSVTSGFFGTTPIAAFGLPGNTAGAGSNIPMSPALPLSGGIQFQAGLAFQITPNMALTDYSAIAASEVLLTLGYRT